MVVQKKYIFTLFFTFLLCSSSLADIHKPVSADEKPRILIVFVPERHRMGGVINHSYKLAQLFKDHGIFSVVLTWKNSYVEEVFKKNNLPCCTFNFDTLTTQHLAQAIEECCSHYNINIIMTHHMTDIPAVEAVASKNSQKVLYVKHFSTSSHFERNLNKLKKINGFIGVNPGVTHVFNAANYHILSDYIPPFWHEDPFLNFDYENTVEKSTFFRTQFNIDIQNLPVLCTVANLYSYKNHELLLRACTILQKRGRLFHLFLAGDGDLRLRLEQQAKKDKLEKYVHFLGSISQIPELLYYADFHVLPSRIEGFPIANLEAASMKKPIITSNKSGCEFLVIHEKTGLLFENNNAEDLAAQIERLLESPSFAQQLGENAYHYVLENFTNDQLFEKWKKFLGQLLN